MQKQCNAPGVFEEFKLFTSRKKEARLASKTALFEVQAFLENVSLVLAHVRDLRKEEGR